MVAVGEVAPDFEAPLADGKSFRLGTLKGKPVILYFYPKADTPGCTIEAQGFRDRYAEFRAKGVEIVGVSVDTTADQHRFQEKYGLPFPLVADAGATVAKRYGVLLPQGVANRVTFFLDPEHRVVDRVEDRSPKPHLDRAVERFLRAG